MFENVSQKIKTMAVAMVVIVSILSIALVILGFIAADSSGLLCGIAIISAVLLFLGTLCSAYFVYGFGELIENTTILKNSINPEPQKVIVEESDDELPEL